MIDVVLLIIVTWEPNGESTDFQLIVRNIAGLRHHLGNTDVLPCRHSIVVNDWNGEAIESFVRRHIERASQLPEAEQIGYLGRHFLWEHEDEELSSP